MATMIEAGPGPEIRRVADLLKQASDPTRLRVLLILGDGDRDVARLCGDLGVQGQTAFSHHLALMRHSGLIEARRQGKSNVYSATEKGRRLIEAVKGLV